MEALRLHELTNCSTDASAKDELILQIVDGIRSANGNAPLAFSQTYEALLCTTGLAMDDALTRVYTIVSETNTNGRTRAAMALVSAGSPPLSSPRTGVEFCVTCFGVGHGAGVCPATPGYAAQCC